MEREKNIRNLIRIPENPISVKICGWIEPKNKLLFSISLTIDKNICLNLYRFSFSSPKELEV